MVLVFICGSFSVSKVSRGPLYSARLDLALQGVPISRPVGVSTWEQQAKLQQNFIPKVDFTSPCLLSLCLRSFLYHRQNFWWFTIFPSKYFRLTRPDHMLSDLNGFAALSLNIQIWYRHDSVDSLKEFTIELGNWTNIKMNQIKSFRCQSKCSNIFCKKRREVSSQKNLLKVLMASSGIISHLTQKLQGLWLRRTRKQT